MKVLNSYASSSHSMTVVYAWYMTCAKLSISYCFPCYDHPVCLSCPPSSCPVTCFYVPLYNLYQLYSVHPSNYLCLLLLSAHLSSYYLYLLLSALLSSYNLYPLFRVSYLAPSKTPHSSLFPMLFFAILSFFPQFHFFPQFS